jgi:hypothetical protein
MVLAIKGCTQFSLKFFLTTIMSGYVFVVGMKWHVFNAYNRPRLEAKKYGNIFAIMGAIQTDWRNRLSVFTK